MLTGYLRQRRRTLLAFSLFGGIFAAAFALYQLPLRAVAYPFVLCAAAGAVLLALDYRRVLRQHRRLELLRQLPEELADALPPADTVTEADYRSLVTLLAESRRAIRTQEEQRYGDMVDYYTMWAHQIKTPIASMRLTLQNEDSGLARSLSGDLMRVEQYVETVVLLSHKKADSYIHIDVEFGEGEGKIPVDSIAKRAEAYKPKEKVTYKMIKEYIEAKYGFKVHTAYIAEVKRNLGLPMYDAPNAVEELKQPRKHPTPEKVEAIKDALRYFAVI